MPSQDDARLLWRVVDLLLLLVRLGVGKGELTPSNFEITGIDVEKELNEPNKHKINIEGKEYAIEEIKKALSK